MLLFWCNSSDFTKYFSREICVDKLFGFACDVGRDIVTRKSFYFFAFFWFVVGYLSRSFGYFVSYVDVLSITSDSMNNMKGLELICVYCYPYFLK
jgi:hypothetical protein